MNLYTKMLIINFIVLNLVVILFHPLFTGNDLNIGLPVIFLITLGVTAGLAGILAKDNPDKRKTILFLSFPGFFLLMIINFLVASGTLQVYAGLFQ